jgi:hypothetical protein
VTAIESCSPEGGFMGRMWAGRRPTVDLLIDLGPQLSPTFIALFAGLRGRARLKALRNQIRAGEWPWKRSKPAQARTPAESPAET